MNATLDAAIDYALHNDWHIVPIPPGQKYPRMKAWQNAASRDTETINQWFTEHPNDGVGIATGAQSGIFVIDVDIADGKTGLTTLTELEALHGELPETFTVRTGTGGFHYYYLYDPARPVRNGRLGEHIDIRGDGGQVLAPPTIHPTTGIAYQVHLDVPCTHAPDWVYDILLPAKTPEPLADPNGQTGHPTIPNRESGTTHIGDDELRPGDHFTASTTWEQLLTADGWTFHSQLGAETRWTRPGKNNADGPSGTVNHTGTDRLKVFTSSVPGLDDNGTYDRFGYWAATRHNGDHRAAATDLAGQGYGTGAQPIDLSWIVETGRTVNLDTGELVDTWDTPIPLGMAPRQLPTFPIDTYPAWLAQQCEAVADDIQVPIDLPATIGLATLAMVCGARINAALDSWHNATNLYLVVASPPGQGKSPVFAAMTACLDRYQKELDTELGPTIAKAEMEHRIAEKQARKAEEKGDLDTAWQHTQTAMAINIPHRPRLKAEDATPEALTKLLGQQNGWLGIMSSEGGLFDLMTGQYSDRANLEVYLKAWGAESITVDRIGREPDHVERAVLTIGLTVQPHVIEKLANKPELAGRGLTARFMYSIPPSNVGKRDMTRRRTNRDAQQHTYDTHIVDLYRTMRSYQTPGTVTLTDQDANTYLQWRQHLENRRDTGGDMEALAEWATKLESSVLRLCGLLHIAHHGNHHGNIQPGIIEKAIQIGNYWIEHAYAVHDLWGTDENLTKARLILNWLINDQAATDFSISELQKGLRRHVDRVADALEPVTILIERGWIRPMFEGPIKVGARGRNAQRFQIHPDAQTHHSRHSRSQTPENDPKQAAIRAISAIRVDTKSEEITHSLKTSEPTHGSQPTNGAGCANDANGANGDNDDIGGYELI